MSTVESYLHFYKMFALRWWNTMGPMEYAGTLIVIGVIGWLLMKNGVR